MMNKKAIISSIISCFLWINSLYSQNLTGTWEGIMGEEFLQVNIVQQNDELCGYTYDYILNNKRNHCKAYFKGYFDKKRQAWILSGNSFIENSGTHVLMRIDLFREQGNGENTLQAIITAKSAIGFILSMGTREFAELRRVSSNPASLPKNMPPCFPEEIKKKEPEVKKDIPKKPFDTTRKTPVNVNPVIDKAPDVPEKKVQPVDPPVDPPVVTIPVKKDTIQQALDKMVLRKNNTISRLPVDVKNITLNVYDNAIVDGDTVTIFYNGKLLVNKQRLSEKPIVINLELDEHAAIHEITLFADNLGSIPPNTALIVVTAGDKRYELHSSASLDENAVLIFEYKPK